MFFDYLRSDVPFRKDIVRKALKTRTDLIPEKFAIFGESVTYLERNQGRFNIFLSGSLNCFFDADAEVNQYVISNIPLPSKETIYFRILLCIPAGIFIFTQSFVGGKKYCGSHLFLPRVAKQRQLTLRTPAVTPLYLQLTIGSCFSVHYRVMEKFGEHEEAYELPEAIAEGNSSFLRAL